MSSQRSADCCAVRWCSPRSSGVSSSGVSNSGVWQGPESAVHRVVNPSLGHGFEEAVGMDEAYGVSGADGGVAAGLGQEALPDASSAHQQHMLMPVQELQGKDSVQQTALQGD